MNENCFMKSREDAMYVSWSGMNTDRQPDAVLHSKVLSIIGSGEDEVEQIQSHCHNLLLILVATCIADDR